MRDRDLPRDQFVTTYYVPTGDNAGLPAWQRRTMNPPRAAAEARNTEDIAVAGPQWLGTVHGPDPVVVALSALDPWGRQVPVSLSPALAATVTLLQTLAPQPGQRVLELGTGVGHTAALLAHRLGPQHVTSVDIDPDLHAHARARLHTVGLRPTLVLGDSAEHCDPDGFDRVLAAHYVDHVPPAWIAAVRPGGRLLLGLRGSLGAGHHVLLHQHLDPATGMASLTGRFLDWTCTQAPLRHRAHRRAVRRPLDPHPGPARSTSTAFPAAQLAENTPLGLFCQLYLPHGTTHAVRADSTGARASYLHAPDGSWAEISHTLDRRGRHDLRWAGVTVLPRLLDAAVDTHQDLRAPAWTDLGLTATTSGTHIWHEPTGNSWPLLGTGRPLSSP